MSNSIQERFEIIKERIHSSCKKAGRDPSEVSLIAVSKTKPDEDVRKLLELGQLHFGENRVEALEKRMKNVPSEEAVWHYIGNLQTNKIKYLAPRVDWIQSVHSLKALKEVEKRAGSHNRKIQVLIQVNISSEEQKSGCTPEELETILSYGENLDHAIVRGLMGMATFTDDLEIVRSEFRTLRELRDRFSHLERGSVKLEHLSMGMTNDLEVAIEEGSTMLRIGTAIFGERNY